MKFEKMNIFYKIALVLGSVVEVALIAVLGYYALILCGNFFEMMCRHMNVILGVALLCLLFFGILILDNEQGSKETQKANAKAATYRRR